VALGALEQELVKSLVGWERRFSPSQSYAVCLGKGCLPGQLLLGGSPQKRGCLANPVYPREGGNCFCQKLGHYQKLETFGVCCLKLQVIDEKGTMKNSVLI